MDAIGEHAAAEVDAVGELQLQRMQSGSKTNKKEDVRSYVLVPFELTAIDDLPSYMLHRVAARAVSAVRPTVETKWSLNQRPKILSPISSTQSCSLYTD